MARPNKLKRFADMNEYPHVFEPDKMALVHEDYSMKGTWKQGFFDNNHPITLELGCGRGEYTVGLAGKFPDRNFLGMDIKGARMWKGASFALQTGLRNVGFVRARIEFIDRIFDQEEVSSIWITFPDPQPKKAIRRLIHPDFLEKYSSILEPDGEIHLKTDSVLLHEYMKAILLENGIVPFVSTSDLYQLAPQDEATELKTKYAEVFLAEGKAITYIRFSPGRIRKFNSPKGFDSAEWI